MCKGSAITANGQQEIYTMAGSALVNDPGEFEMDKVCVTAMPLLPMANRKFTPRQVVYRLLTLHNALKCTRQTITILLEQGRAAYFYCAHIVYIWVCMDLYSLYSLGVMV